MLGEYTGSFKRYVLLFLLTKSFDEVLFVRRNKLPFKSKLNGIGGKIEDDESVIDAAHRECMEELSLFNLDFKFLCNLFYPKSYINSDGMKMYVFYTTIDKMRFAPNAEGSYEWYDVSGALNFNNKELAGHANIALFIREILLIENKLKFYD